MNITRLTSMRHPELVGVTVFPLSGEPSCGIPQEILVCVDPGTTIPLHTHNVNAQMIVTGGRARVLYADSPEEEVTAGSCVFFEKSIPHGFQVGDQPFSFISRNGGIVGMEGWDIHF